MQPTDRFQGLMKMYDAVMRLINGEGGSKAERERIAAPVVEHVKSTLAASGYHLSYDVLVPPGMEHNVVKDTLELKLEAVAPAPAPIRPPILPPKPIEEPTKPTEPTPQPAKGKNLFKPSGKVQ